MTDRELMQQALEALERYSGVDQRACDAEEALRERLAQPEQEPVKFNCTVVDDAHPEGVPLSQWGKQQKQKPFCYHDGRNIVGKEYAHHCDVFPLYTEPQPEQEPLTDERVWLEYMQLWPFRPNEEPTLAKDILRFARAIEAAHGIGEKPDAA